MTRFKKRIVVFLALFVVVGIWLFCFLDVNGRFLQTDLQECHIGEWMDYRNNHFGYTDLQLSPVSMKLLSSADFVEEYPKDGEGFQDKDYKIVVMTIRVKNNGKDDVYLDKLATSWSAVAYPVGWMNQGKMLNASEKRLLKSYSETEISLRFAVSKSMVSDKKMKLFLASKFYLSVKVYPEKKVLIFDTVDVDF